MTGGGKKLHQAVLALLECGQIEEAAKKSGVSVSTFQRLMKTDAFGALYADARRQVYEIGLSRLQALTGDAIRALKRNLTCGRPLAEIRAAIGILEHARHGAELLDLAERIAKLEAGLHESQTKEDAA